MEMPQKFCSTVVPAKQHVNNVFTQSKSDMVPFPTLSRCGTLSNSHNPICLCYIWGIMTARSQLTCDCDVC